MKFGKMPPMGLTKIEAATEDGAWHALDHLEMLKLPDDLTAALTRGPAGCCQFQSICAFAQARHSGLDQKRQNSPGKEKASLQNRGARWHQ
jgi:uncharacterized protein YdeI (YjbR/CyaY-like superfamily)